MTVLLNRAYSGMAAGTIATLDAATESALVAQGIAAVSAGPLTPGPLTVNYSKGRAVIAAASISVVITNSMVAAESSVFAVISQAGADVSLTSVVRVVPVAGSFTIIGNAASTAAVQVDWFVLNNSAAAGLIR